MANAYGPREWKLDTTGAIMTGPVRVARMHFVPNAASDDVLVSNTAGDKVWEITNALAPGRAGAEEIDFGACGYQMEGFTLTTFTASAVLYVWLL